MALKATLSHKGDIINSYHALNPKRQDFRIKVRRGGGKERKPGKGSGQVTMERRETERDRSDWCPGETGKGGKGVRAQGPVRTAGETVGRPQGSREASAESHLASTGLQTQARRLCCLSPESVGRATAAPAGWPGTRRGLPLCSLF